MLDEIVYIGFHGSSQHRLKDTRHHELVGGSNIFHTKRHHVVAMHPCWSYECSVCRIEGIHLDLIVTRVRGME